MQTMVNRISIVVALAVTTLMTCASAAAQSRRPSAAERMQEQVEGRFMRSNLVLTQDGADHEFARQHWIIADGTEREWLAVEYEYTRKVKAGK
ncbi:MAG: hypothetical protein ACM358_14175 [Gemmatimonadota bacterium]